MYLNTTKSTTTIYIIIQTIKSVFICLIGVLRSAQRYFIYTMATSIMGGKHAMPRGNPRTSADFSRPSHVYDRGGNQDYLDLNSNNLWNKERRFLCTDWYCCWKQKLTHSCGGTVGFFRGLKLTCLLPVWRVKLGVKLRKVRKWFTPFTLSQIIGIWPPL